MVTHIACGIAFYRVKVTFNLMASKQVVCNVAGYLHPVRLRSSCRDLAVRTMVQSHHQRSFLVARPSNKVVLMITEFLDLIHNVVEAQRELSAPFDWQIQLASVAAAGAAPLPDISFRESAAQTLERAITTRATVLTSLRTTGRCALILSRTLDIGKVQNEQSHSAWFVKTTKKTRTR